MAPAPPRGAALALPSSQHGHLSSFPLPAPAATVPEGLALPAGCSPLPQGLELSRGGITRAAPRARRARHRLTGAPSATSSSLRQGEHQNHHKNRAVEGGRSTNPPWGRPPAPDGVPGWVNRLGGSSHSGWGLAGTAASSGVPGEAGRPLLAGRAESRHQGWAGGGGRREARRDPTSCPCSPKGAMNGC